MLRNCLLSLALLSTMGAATAQDAPAANVELGQKDDYCVDLYTALDDCVDAEQEEKACTDLKSSDDLPFNNLQAQLEDWPKGYAPQQVWFAYCQRACQGKPKPAVGVFAKQVCRVRLANP